VARRARLFMDLGCLFPLDAAVPDQMRDCLSVCGVYFRQNDEASYYNPFGSLPNQPADLGDSFSFFSYHVDEIKRTR
jgi:hypothetical protein